MKDFVFDQHLIQAYPQISRSVGSIRPEDLRSAIDREQDAAPV